MEFNPQEFIRNPSVEVFEKLKNNELLSLAKLLKVRTRKSMRKQTIKNILIDKLVEEEYFNEEVLDIKKESYDAILELEKTYELKVRELGIKEKCKNEEYEFRIRELETKEKLELKKLRLEIKNVNEKSVEKIFPHFDKITDDVEKCYESSLKNSEVINNIDSKVVHLNKEQNVAQNSTKMYCFDRNSPHRLAYVEPLENELVWLNDMYKEQMSINKCDTKIKEEWTIEELQRT